MPQAPLLAEHDVEKHLQPLPHWSREGAVIKRSFKLSSFMHAIDFVNRVAQAAETAHHHPDMDIRFNQVTFVLTTHDSGGITLKDIELANRIEESAPDT